MTSGKDIKKEALGKLNFLFLNAIRNSIDADNVMSRHKDELLVNLSKDGFQIFSSPAIYFGNFGRAPGKRPVKIEGTGQNKKVTYYFEDWAKRHNIESKYFYSIAKKIGKEGTTGRNFLPDFKKEMIEAEKIIFKTIGNAFTLNYKQEWDKEAFKKNSIIL